MFSLGKSSANNDGVLSAIDRSQAVIEFMPDGTIVKANANFLGAVGYTLEEVAGKHHAIFVDPAERDTETYKAFWKKLGSGEFDAGKYKRFGKGGREIWIEASYNPVLDRHGRVAKVVKFATDITAQQFKSFDYAGQIAAIGKAQAVIEFDTKGNILDANDNFLGAVGYARDEIVGKHHSMFVEAAEKDSPAYKLFWDKLGRGEFDAGQYRRIAKGGREIWIQASYNPILDAGGKPFKVVKFATDITGQKLKTADFEGQIAAIGKVMAVIEFELDGTIRHANENFLKTLGYSLDEVRGQHHRLFVDEAERSSAAYKAFWDKLARGEFDSGEYKRIAKGGREIWIQASYNPILDMNGKPFKVVKYATDVTAAVQARQALRFAVDKVVGAVNQNDLSQRIPMDDKSGEIAALCEGFNGLLDKMTEVVTVFKDTAREVGAASSEISASTTDLSQRTEEQAASLEETSASMEEIAATVKKNAENAQAANQSSASTQDVADRGGKVVAQAVDAMAKIEESSRRISDIIGVIDEIARQTNLLALNAAVEAARAGDAGRGFAVVASEVRSLAQRSSQAAKDIKDLITNSGGQVKDGVELVNRAGTALTEIVASIKEVAVVVADIANASAEQAGGVEQVNKALTQMDEVTQQNSALVEENAATAKTLESQARAMNERIAVFRLSEHEAPPMAPSADADRAASKPAARPAAKSAAKTPPQPGVGPARRMQANLATALKTDPDWEEF